MLLEMLLGTVEVIVEAIVEAIVEGTRLNWWKIALDRFGPLPMELSEKVKLVGAEEIHEVILLRSMGSLLE